MAKSRLNSDEIKCAVYTVKFASYVKRTLLIFPRINGPNCSTSKIERIRFIPAGKWITRHTRPELFYPYTNSTRSEDLFFFFKRIIAQWNNLPSSIFYWIPLSWRQEEPADYSWLAALYKLYSKCSEIFMKCNIFSLRNLYKNMRC